MTSTPELEAPIALESDEEPSPRYAAQRVTAAQMTGLPHQLLLRRAKSEGQAHRRSESAEGACLLPEDRN